MKASVMTSRKYTFASDNTAGICPEAWEAMQMANTDFFASYGSDEHTRRACDLMRQFFETPCEVFFVFNGTAANSLALASLCQSYHSVVTHELSHIETDECGAPEFFSNGSKLLLVGGAEGKMDVAQIEKTIIKRQDIHYPRPQVLSISQSTELGTVYTPEEIRTLCRTAETHGLRVHMDGARFFNALAATGASPADLTWRAGVDVLCLGGTKAGIGTSEAVVFFDTKLAGEFGYRCKQAGQLASKMRFLSAPWCSVLRDNIWRKHAENANNLARELAVRASAVPGVQLARNPQANAVFLTLPADTRARLDAAGWAFYSFIGVGECRFMTNWATTIADVEALVRDMQGS